jgi:hypothetical protein
MQLLLGYALCAPQHGIHHWFPAFWNPRRPQSPARNRGGTATADQQLLHAAQYLHARIFLSALFSTSKNGMWLASPFGNGCPKPSPKSAWRRMQER